MGYPPGQRGYCVCSIATHHFFTSSNVIFDENIPYNSLHSLSTVSNDYSTLPFLEERPAVIPEAPALPPNPFNLDAEDHLELLDTSPSPPPAVPVTPPHGPQLGPPPTPHPVQTHSQESLRVRKLTEKGRLFEQKIDAERDHLMRVREAVARRGGESTSGSGRNEGEGGDESEGISEDDEENPFVAGGFENVASLAMAASLDAEDYLRQDVDSLCEATLLSIRSDV